MGVFYVPLISCEIFINDTKISGGIMKDLQLMHDVMQSSLNKDNDWDFAKDLSDVRKVLEWLEEFKLNNHDEIKFFKKWDR